MALWSNTATTEESTPPESAQRTRSPPTIFRMAATSLSMKDFIDQSPLAPQASRKFRSTVLPWAVCATSGWNWTPKSFRAGSAMAATGQFSVEPRATKPGGGFITVSPWLIHTRMWPSRSGVTSRRSPPWPAIRQPAVAGDEEVAGPLFSPRRGHALTAKGIPNGLHPVADPEHGNARLEQPEVGQRCALVVDAGGPAGEDDALVTLGEDLLERLRARDDFGVHGHLADAAGDELAVLCAEIQDADLVHADPEQTLCVPQTVWQCMPARPSVASPASGRAGTPCLRS